MTTKHFAGLKTKNTWTVKNVKSWNGTDGIGTECSLYRNGKRVAICLDEGCGGEMHFQWLDAKAAPCLVTAEEKLLVDHAATRTWTSDHDGDTFPYSIDMIVSELCDEYETQKRMKARLRKQTWLHLKDQEYEDGEWSVIKQKFTPELHHRIQKQYGDNLGEILNLTIEVTA